MNRNRSRRNVVRTSTDTTIESLEGRVFLSAAVKTAAAKAVSAPIVRDLIDLSALPGREGIKMQRAGAELFDGATTIVPAKNGRTEKGASASTFAGFTLNLPALRQKLGAAPMEFTAAAKASPLTVALPTPDGGWARFYVVQSPIMEPGLAAKFPDIKTYSGVGVDDPSARIRLNYTMLGFQAQVLSPNGAYYINPQYVADANGTYMSFYKRDAKELDKNATYVEGEIEHAPAPAPIKETQALPFGNNLRTFRTAVAAAGEYTQFFGGTVAAGQAAVVQAIDRVTGVYESELAIRLILVANNSNAIYTNPATDPYTNANAYSANTGNLNQASVIGTANYDIGHVFLIDDGGVAQLGCVGSDSVKGRGVTGRPEPVGDPFTIDYVAHEMGHQFNAEHTFNASSNAQRSAAHAYEPGSGSTIMGYAGITGTEDLQPNSDPYFSWDSIDAIRAFITNSIPGIGGSIGTGNNAPTVNAGSDYIIPANTPFALTATSFSDPDGNSLTFDWQEMDRGAGTLLSTADNGASPLFRVYNPTTSPTRMFPKQSTILAGLNNTPAPSPGSGRSVERLPTMARAQMKFRVIARDNQPNGGGVASDDMFVQVIANGAFDVTAPNTAVSWSGGSTQAITWDVSATNAAPFNVGNVKISFSSDGGVTFPTVLAASTPNDGSENLTIPSIGTTQGRIKIEAIGNIFFDVSNVNFTVAAATPAPGTPLLIAGDTGFSASDGITNQNNTSTKKLTFRIPNTVAGAAVTLRADNTTTIGTGTGNGGDLDIVTNGSATLATGAHTINVYQTAVGSAQSANSGSFNLFIDTTAPQVVASSTVFSITPNKKLTFVTNETLPQLLQGELTLQNLTAATTVPTAGFTASYDGPSKTGTFDVGTLADASYRAIFTASDAAGNALAGTNNLFNFIYVGGATAHTLLVSRSATLAQVTKDGTTSFFASYSTLSQIALEGSSAHDDVTVDFSGGTPIPANANGFRYVGGAGNDNFTVTGAGSFVFGNDPSIDTQGMQLTAAAGATVDLNGAGVSTVGSLFADSGTINLAAGGSRLLVTSAVDTNAAGKIDLRDNDMLVHNGAVTAVSELIGDAYNFGNWNGGGITSSTAAGNSITMLGALSGDEYLANANSSVFDAQPVVSSDVLVKYTYFGDVDFNGQVDTTDYNIIDFGFLTGASGWANGDVDYNSQIDTSDYNQIDFAFLTQNGVVL